MKVKAIRLNTSDSGEAYYLLPSRFGDEAAFVEHLSCSRRSFIELTKLSEHIRWPQACFPYFINEDCRACLVKIGLGAEIEFVEVTLLPRKEYNDRLATVFNEKCFTCKFSNNWNIETLEHGGFPDLDGICDGYQKLDPPRNRPKPTHLKIRYW